MDLRFHTIPRVFYVCEFYMLLTLSLAFNLAAPLSSAQAQDRGTIYTGEPQLVSGYDRFSDETSVGVETVVTAPEIRDGKQVFDARRGVVQMIAGYNHAGTRLSVAPRTIRLAFIARSSAMALSAPPHRFFAAGRVHALVDGKPLDLGHATPQAHTGGLFKTESAELLRIEVPTPVFRRLARSSRIELRIGGTELALAERNLRALKVVADTLPAGGRATAPDSRRRRRR